MGGTEPLQALVFGRNGQLIEAVPALLSRAGFSVTVLTTAHRLKNCLHVDRFILAKGPNDLLQRARSEMANDYCLVVAADDSTLASILQSDMPIEEKLRLLPVCSAAGIEHIVSKIGLSRVLTAAGVQTPAFAVARVPADLAKATTEVGFPLMIKSDFGRGGRQVVEARSPADIVNLPPEVTFPVLVQARIEGELVDCSGFFRDGELVTFSYSVALQSLRDGLGPSILRRYWTKAEADTDLVAEVARFGRALSASGFVTTSAIRSVVDGRLYFIEGDMRPNVWVEYPKYFGVDPAHAIASAYGNPRPPKPNEPQTAEHMVLPYLPRMRLIDIALNKYNCRAYFQSYTQRPFLLDRLEDWVGQLTLRRLAGWLRRVPRRLAGQ